MLNFFMLFCIYPILPIMYFYLANEAKPKKNIILGVTLSYLERQDNEVLSILEEYKNALRKVGIILAGIPIITCLTPYFSVVLTVLLCWINVVIALFFYIFIRYNLKLKAYKLKNREAKAIDSVEHIDGKGAEPQNYTNPTKDTIVTASQKISLFWFVLPVIISIFPILLDVLYKKTSFSAYVFLYVINILFTIMFWGFHEIIYKQQPELVDNNVEVSAELTKVRRHNWSKSFLMMTWCTAFFNICLYLFSKYDAAIIVIAILYSFVILYYVLKAEFTTRRVQEILTVDSGKEIFQDDDEDWIFGLFYHNPTDTHLMVNDRTGIGMSLNMAKPIAKAVMILSAVLLLLTPALGVWTMFEEFTDIKPVITGHVITINHWKEEYKVDFSEIKDVSMMETLPKSRKIVGTGMSHLLKGTFDVNGIGKCRLYVNPKEAPFIMIQTEDEIVIIGSGGEEDIHDIYEEILKNLN